MDIDTVDPEVLGSERSSSPDRVLVIEQGEFKVFELILTTEIVQWIWEKMNSARTLFTDITRGDYENFVALLTQDHSYWLEVEWQGSRVGIVYFTDMHLITDCYAHLAIFGRRALDQDVIEVCKAIIQWMFKKFHLRRMTVAIPKIYFYTTRLAKRCGFVAEGKRRDVYSIGGKWVDELIFGIVRG